MRSWWRGDWRWSGIRIDLVVEQTPLLQERVQPDYGADVSSQVPPTCRRRYVLKRVQSIGIDHEVTIRHIDIHRLALVFAVEELGHRTLLDLMHSVIVEPRCIGWNDDVMGLLDDVSFGWRRVVGALNTLLIEIR